jgi:Tfp pilus assembly protein PilO
MRANERMIIVGVAIVALAVGFYVMVLSPKRDEASKLSDQINQLHGSITAAQQQVTYGEQARQDFPEYYSRMVVLGKAVPAQSDTASLLVQLSSLTNRSETDLRAITLNSAGAGGDGSASSAATPSATSPSGAASTASTASSTSSTGSATGSAPPSTGTATPTASPAPATEATAAALPIGSVVGPAGLPTTPYTLMLEGGYFDIANFIGKVDDLVSPVASGSQVAPDGRLLTINGFGLELSGIGPSPNLKASFLVTTYSTGDQGLTLGASPSGPAPTSPSAETQAQPASAVVPK